MLQYRLNMPFSSICDEFELAGAAIGLGARRVRGWSCQEEQLASTAVCSSRDLLNRLKSEIQTGADPLGAMFTRLRAPDYRRVLGATFTPTVIISSMLGWVEARGLTPSRVIEPGVGPGRFLLGAGRLFPQAELLGVEVDPLAAMIARANLASVGFGDRSQILLEDYRFVTLPRIEGVTLYIGNPPYVRHHQIDSASKRWLTRAAAKLGYEASQLSGMHVHFYLATALKAHPGDFGVFITSSEWLDVNYGRLVRQLFLKQLGGESLTVLEPTARPFEDAATTGAIATFAIGTRAQRIRVSRVADSESLGNLCSGQLLHRGRFESESRWSHLTRKARQIPTDYVELGELCRVHRGQVTGANHVWIAGSHSLELPSCVLFRTVTRARELFNAEGVLSDDSCLRDVIDLPQDLDELSASERRCVDRFLRYAKKMGAGAGYIARTRKTWWSVGLREPAPILATYMARRPPAFVRNLAEARHLNIAHGLYPRDALSTIVLDKLAKYLSGAVSVAEGRTYAGGLTKFEPREMERLIVPNVALLTSAS